MSSSNSPIESSPQSQLPFPGISHRLYCSPRGLCLTSKPVLVILAWVFVVACVFRGLQYISVFAIPATNDDKYDPVHRLSFIYFICFYAFMALVTAFYPVSGFIADVCCGRYKMVMVSLVFIWVALLMAVIAVIAMIPNPHGHITSFSIAMLSIASVVVIPGLSGFYSNMVQLSLDQLQDAPSHTLGVFLHWCEWVEILGQSLIHLVFALTVCAHDHNKFNNVIRISGYYSPGLFFVLLSMLLVIGCFTKRWFVITDTQYNPYKVVLNVLRFVRKHKHPIRHSAMHWTNGDKPSRFDFAKECYGGPFTSSQVEDVKTLGRVILVLLSVGPVFIVSVPTSYFIIPLFSFHVTNGAPPNCPYVWVLVDSGLLSYLIALVCFPVFIWLVYCVLRNRVPEILSRLELGMFMSIVGVFSMLLLDLVGHSLADNDPKQVECMFVESYGLNHKHNSNNFFSLHLPWYVLLVPTCFNVFSQCIVRATILEFISAQAPQPMKGLVFGIMFALKGCYNFLGAASLVPFSLGFWSKLYSPYLSCGFSYLLVTLVVSITGLLVFGCMRKGYRYRRRGEEPFPQAVVEEIYERRLLHNNSMDNSSIIVCDTEGCHGNTLRATQNVQLSEGSRDARQQLSMSHDWNNTFKYNDL